ncbi:hypothetical protein L873DRAFT_1806937 [Choiromyces venosus 120613-1]|uniref:Uncharacterized protein n=1 Tax=Choiromyces venosus 120613-1 TaxID=1336337 RepID=A0A3N4K0E4_9PEZI|nr:hypothetical protein L873DRAFT_1806937 [Choiromyces venosus 120613-1]
MSIHREALCKQAQHTTSAYSTSLSALFLTLCIAFYYRGKLTLFEPLKPRRLFLTTLKLYHYDEGRDGGVP